MLVQLILLRLGYSKCGDRCEGKNERTEGDIYNWEIFGKDLSQRRLSCETWLSSLKTLTRLNTFLSIHQTRKVSESCVGNEK